MNNVLVGYSFRKLLEAPGDILGERGENLLAAFIVHSKEYFGPNRLEVLERFKDTFDAALQEKRRYIEHKQRLDGSYVVFTEEQAVEIVEICRPLVERTNMGITRLVSSRLKVAVIEDLLVNETEFTNYFYTFVAFQARFMKETEPAYKFETSLDMWLALQNFFHQASLFVLILDGLLEGTAFRERQRRGEHGHWTTTASERKMG